MRLIIFVLVFSSAFYGVGQINDQSKSFNIGFLDIKDVYEVKVLAIVKSENEYYLFRKDPIKGPGGFNYYIEKFNSDLESIGKIDLTTQFEEARFSFVDVIESGENIFLISERTDDQRHTYFQLLDKKYFEIEEPRLLFSQEIYENKFQADLTFVQSPDKKKNLFFSYNTENNQVQLVDLHLYDNAMEEIFDYPSIPYDQNKKRDGLFDLVIDNDERIYLLYRDSRPQLERNYIVEYELSIIENNGQVKKQKLRLKGAISSVKMIIDKNSHLKITGFYGKINSVGNDGIFYYTLDKNNDSLSKCYQTEFTKSFSNSELTVSQEAHANARSKINGTNSAMKNLSLHNVILHKDNSISLVGELYYYVSSDRGPSKKIYSDYIIVRITDEKMTKFTRYLKEEKHDKVPYVEYDNNLIVIQRMPWYFAEGLFLYEYKGKEKRKLKKEVLGAMTITSFGSQTPQLIFNDIEPPYDNIIPENKLAMQTRFIHNPADNTRNSWGFEV